MYESQITNYFNGLPEWSIPMPRHGAHSSIPIPLNNNKGLRARTQEQSSQNMLFCLCALMEKG